MKETVTNFKWEIFKDPQEYTDVARLWENNNLYEEEL